MTCLIIGLAVALIGLLAERGVDGFDSTTGYLASSLFVAAAGLLSTGLVTRARATTPSVGAAIGGCPDLALQSPIRRACLQILRRPLSKSLRAAGLWICGWLPIVTPILLGAAAMASVIMAWTSHNPGALAPQVQQAVGGLLIVLAFPFLVLERIYANTLPEVLPEATQLERLMRVPLITFLSLGITSVLRSFGWGWPGVIERAIAVLLGLVSAELVLRGAAAAFLPVNQKRSCADSTIANMLRLAPPTPATFGAAIANQFGIDLSRSLALAFVHRAGLGIALAMLVPAWCLTGLTALGYSQRAVYERLGAPVAVLGPGLHIHLPWPLGVLHPVELGVVHEVPIVFSASNSAFGSSPAAGVTGVEDVPPESVDRLWDMSHPAEASYLIASEAQGKQSFQVVNIDLRLIYRVGLSDTAAAEAAYAVDDPEALLRAIAGQRLVRYFAHNKLLDVLVENRERFALNFRHELQDELQHLSTGIELIAVIVEAIHPPPGAANAYHNVQAAEILAHSQIAARQADAILQTKSAQQDSTKDRDDALGRAAELVNRARAEDVLFDSDRQAYSQQGRAFLLERWLRHLTGALAKSTLVVIDHRLKGATAPTIDFRKFGWPGAAAQDTPSSREKEEGN